MAFSKIIVSCSVVLIAAFSISSAQNGDAVTCVNQLIEWCSNMTFNNGYSNFLTTEVTNSGQMMIHCMSGSGGTNCTINNFPWFSCPLDHKVQYKGSILQKNSVNGTDSDICHATRKATMTYGEMDENAKKAFKEGMEHLNQSMENLQKRLQSTVGQSCFPFCHNNPFGPGFPFNNGK